MQKSSCLIIRFWYILYGTSLFSYDFLLNLSLPYARPLACDIIMYSSLLVSAHDLPVLKNMFYNIVLRQHFSKSLQK